MKTVERGVAAFSVGDFFFFLNQFGGGNEGLWLGETIEMRILETQE